ncbi:hypothetical protein X797_002079 [Metarhizium robertsii]|uniref:Uncharacterized protein n=1 Tax=Metarhizium robertsii TaxID=568076 RepID=A0A0A1V442_9HYPO|nr:hypothetical protein X797_002079 [Metarhizium robertsii]
MEGVRLAGNKSQMVRTLHQGVGEQQVGRQPPRVKCSAGRFAGTVNAPGSSPCTPYFRWTLVISESAVIGPVCSGPLILSSTPGFSCLVEFYYNLGLSEIAVNLGGRRQMTGIPSTRRRRQGSSTIPKDGWLLCLLGAEGSPSVCRIPEGFLDKHAADPTQAEQAGAYSVSRLKPVTPHACCTMVLCWVMSRRRLQYTVTLPVTPGEEARGCKGDV